jgi:hypothetical protein
VVDRNHPAVPSTIAEQRRRAATYASSDADPPRRRRSALLGGGVLIASSPVTVGAGLFVPGFAALGLGALLLLVPPRVPGERKRGAPWRLVRAPAAAGGRATLAVARGSARTGVNAFWAVERFAANDGRDGAVRIGAAASGAAAGLGRTASTAASHGWTAVEVAAPRAWHGLVAFARAIARAARSAAVWTWMRLRPLLRRARLACRAGLTALAEHVAVLARSASERLSAYVDSRSRPR